MQKSFFEITIGFLGFILILYSTNWISALGVFLMIWANNIRDINE